MATIKTYKGETLIEYRDDSRAYDVILGEYVEREYKNCFVKVDWSDLSVGVIHLYADKFWTNYHTKIFTSNI